MSKTNTEIVTEAIRDRHHCSQSNFSLLLFLILLDFMDLCQFLNGPAARFVILSVETLCRNVPDDPVVIPSECEGSSEKISPFGRDKDFSRSLSIAEGLEMTQEVNRYGIFAIYGTVADGRLRRELSRARIKFLSLPLAGEN